MDELTLRYYSEEAKNISDKYNNVSSGLQKYFSTVFVEGMKILDIGCGSGRDMAILIQYGIDIYGVDASPEMVQYAQEKYPELQAKIDIGVLPNLGKPFGGEFDGVLCSAVLMHLPKEELFDAAFSIRNLMKEGGRLLVSMPHDRPDIDEHCRDSKGRLFNSVKPEYLQLLFERLGFSIIGKWKTEDSTRPGYSWFTIAFNLKYSGSIRPIDQVESVLTRDKKTATYKLALIRAFSEVAIIEYKTARWLENGMVGIPLSVIAEKWLYYYWPIFESTTFIPQIRGEEVSCSKPVAFRASLTELIIKYKRKGGLNQFVLDFRSNRIDKDTMKLLNVVLHKIAYTIVSGPVTYAGGSLESGRLFKYDRNNREILLNSEIWIELSLMGYWIRDAVLLRWAELTADLARKEMTPSDVIDLLLVTPAGERDVVDARVLYSSLSQKECTWTGRNIKSDFDVDHIIPFSLWHNNDLWNLVPVLPSVNNQKRDRLPSRDLLSDRKECLIHYWEALRERYRLRFDREACSIMGFVKTPDNWHTLLFNIIAEAIEITAIQRGCERWPL